MTDHLLITISIRTLAIAGLSIVIGALFRTARPSTRSLAWNSALLACLITPLVWTVAPTVTVFVPAKFLFAAAAPAVVEQSAATPAVTIDANVSPGAGAHSSDRNGNRAGQILLYLWLSGVLFFAIRFGRQVLCARRFARGASRFDHSRLEPLLAEGKSSLGIRRDVAVLQSSQIDIPLAAGILHPLILLPASAREWTEDELRIVLLHELAHVRRADIAARAVAMIACTVHWFNPLVWTLASLSTRDAELAADDLVLSAGVRPSTYADALLNLAGSVFRFPAAEPAMPLARRAALADRVHAILRESAARTDIGHFTRLTVIAGISAIAMLTACVRFAPASPLPPSRFALPASSPVAMTKPTAPRSISAAHRGVPAATADSSWIDGATDGLIRALADASPQVRGGAAHSLGRLHAERARAALLELVNDPDKYVRYEAEQALTSLDRTN